MKNKVKAKVLRKVRKCYFCGRTGNMTKHHIIFKEFLVGQVLENNTEDICKKCHDKFHALAKPMIDTLVEVLNKVKPKKVRKIGFRRTNGKEKKNIRKTGDSWADGYWTKK